MRYPGWRGWLTLFLVLGSVAFVRGNLVNAETKEILLRGRIITGDPGRPVAEVLAIRAGRISYVGDAAGAPKVAEGRVFQMPGTVLPGLVDAHAHLLGLGLSKSRLDLVGVSSYQELLERVRKREARLPENRWLLGRGWDQNDWRVQDFPTRQALDEVCPARPVYLTRIDGHAALVNSVALRASGIGKETPDPPGGRILRDSRGEPTGVLVDNAMDLVRLPQLGAQDRMEAMEIACRLAAEAGLTAVHDMGNGIQSLRALHRLAVEGRLPIRVYAFMSPSVALAEQPVSPPGGGSWSTGRLTVRGVKFFADGALGSRGAALDVDYSDSLGNRGLLLANPEELCRQMEQATKIGLQIAVHVIGNRAAGIALDCIENLHRAGIPPDRPRLEHAQVFLPQDFSRAARLGVIASMQPTHATSDMPWAKKRLGFMRIHFAYAWKTMLRAGVPLAFGSDFPVESHRPMLGFYAAMTRQNAKGAPPGGWYPRQRLSFQETLSAFTAGPAYASFQEEQLGTLVPGKLADLTVLDIDPRSPKASTFLDAKILMTMVQGRVVHLDSSLESLGIGRSEP